ncbi:MAG: ABC transporter permease [Candidatus Diapherotrites archaeon]|nr:ABC transporter permease [Candidatus Diapherotrites archaeon]
MFKEALLNLSRRKSRTVLALVGIILGVAAIITLVSVVDGVASNAEDYLSEFKGISVTQKDVVTPLYSSFDSEFLNKVESIPGVNIVVSAVVGLSNVTEQKRGVRFSKERTMMQMTSEIVSLLGVDLKNYSRVHGTVTPLIGELEEGRNLKMGDVGKTVISRELADNYRKRIGNSIELADKKFDIVGISKSGVSFGGMMSGTAVVSIDDAREMLDLEKDKVGLLYVEPIDFSNTKQVANRINFVYGDDLEANIQGDFLGQAMGIFSSLRSLVYVVGAISAIVAGIGILNVMLMSVLERTREFGTLRAVGWLSSDVMKMVLFESVLLGVIGGLLGLLFGVFISFQITALSGLNTLVSFEVLFFSFMFALAVSVLAGIYPAFRASKMSVMEALRNE